MLVKEVEIPTTQIRVTFVSRRLPGIPGASAPPTPIATRARPALERDEVGSLKSDG